jgi:hypothetical protein
VNGVQSRYSFVGDITAQKLLFTQESSFLGIHLKPPLLAGFREMGAGWLF